MTDHYAEAKRLVTDSGSGVPPYYSTDDTPNLTAALVHATLAVADNLAWAFQLADRAEADEAAALMTEQLLAEPPPGSPCMCSHLIGIHAPRLDPTEQRGVCLTGCGCLGYEAAADSLPASVRRTQRPRPGTTPIPRHP